MNPIDIVLKIQREYLKILESYFKREREELDISSQSDVEYAFELFLHRRPSLIVPYGRRSLNVAEYQMLRLVEDIERFWQSNGEELIKQLKKSDLLLLSADRGYPIEGIPMLVRKHGIYFDTLCFSCPLSWMGSEMLREELLLTRTEGPKPAMVTFFATYVDVVRSIRNILLKTSPPTFIIYPSSYLSRDEVLIFQHKKQGARVKLQLLADRFYFHLEKFFEEVFDREFDFAGSKEAEKFIYSVKPSKLHQEKLTELLRLIGGEKILKHVLRSVIGRAGLQGYDEDISHRLTTLARDETVRSAVNKTTLLHLWRLLCGALMSTEMIYLDGGLRGIDCHVPDHDWHLCRWKLNNESAVIRKSLNLSEGEVVQYVISKKLKWLSHLSLEQVIAIRRSPQLSEARNLLRGYRDKLGGITMESLDDVSERIQKEVTERISEYHQLVASNNELRKKGLTRGILLGLAGGAWGVTSLIIPFPLALAVTSTVGSVIFGLGGKSVLDIYHEYQQGKRNLQELRKSPISILAQVYEQNVREESKSSLM